MSQFFVKRGEKIHGPFSESQLRAGLKSKKLSSEDLISQDRSGPWRLIKAKMEQNTPAKKPENDVMSWLDGDSSVSSPRRQEEANNTESHTNAEAIRAEKKKQLLEEAKQQAKNKTTPVTKAETHGNPKAESVYEDEQVKISENRITIKKTASPDANPMYYREDDSMLSLVPKKISSMDIASGVKVLPGKAAERKLIYVGGALAAFPAMFWFIVMINTDATGPEADDTISLLFQIVPLIIIGALLIAYGSISLISKAKKHLLKINIDGKHTHIAFKEKSDAIKVYEIIEQLSN